GYAAYTTGTVDTAWNGVGTFHENPANYKDGNTSYNITGIPDRARMINNTVIIYGGRSILLDPEFTGVRPKTGTNPTDPFGPFPTVGSTTDPRSYIPKNAPYTYPDLKDFYLAQISPETGEVLVPSYGRPWLWGPRTLEPPSPNNPGIGGNQQLWRQDLGKFWI